MILFNKLFRIFHRNIPKSSRELNPLFESGFHGDRYLLDYVGRLAVHIRAFVETGANVGTTLRYMAAHYPNIELYSCEPDEIAFNRAHDNLGTFVNRVYFYNMLSPDFLYRVHNEHPKLLESLNFYWLDAHGYGFHWPLHDEISYLTQTLPSAFIMIDDTEIPGLPQFKYAEYDGQICNRAYILDALTPNKTYHIVSPQYTEHTSTHHPLVGVTLIAFGEAVAYLPDVSDFRVEVLTA